MPGESVERIPGYTGHEVQTKPGSSLSVPPPPPEPLMTIYPRVEGLRLVNEKDTNFSAPAATAVPIYSHAQLERMSKPGIQVQSAACKIMCCHMLSLQVAAPTRGGCGSCVCVD